MTEFTDLAPTYTYNGLHSAVDYAIGGLLTDGGHHKQWYLERILESLGISLDDLRKELNKDDYDWEEGIAP